MNVGSDDENEIVSSGCNGAAEFRNSQLLGQHFHDMCKPMPDQISAQKEDWLQILP